MIAMSLESSLTLEFSHERLRTNRHTDRSIDRYIAILAHTTIRFQIEAVERFDRNRVSKAAGQSYTRTLLLAPP